MNRKQILSILSSFTGHENVIAVPKVLVDLTGDWGLAAMLNQLIYWSDKSQRADGYVYRSAKDWEDELAVSEYTVRKFKQLPYIKAKVLRANSAPTTHYKLDIELMIKMIQDLNPVQPELPICRNQRNDSSKSTIRSGEINETLTEITTEITTDTISPHQAMIVELSAITGMDIKIKSNAGRLGKTSKELLSAGYTAEDLKRFQAIWKDDWRSKDGREKPTLAVIVSDIGKIKQSVKADTSIEERRRMAEAELRKARKQND